MNVSHVIFDLDGTLIDSAPSILACMEQVIADAGLAPALPLQVSLIGPPLKTTLATITGLSDDDLLQALVEAFKERYDSEGLYSTRPYPEIPETLRQLRARGMKFHLTTNKRSRPTLAILEMLGWRELFLSVTCQDSVTPGYAHKAAMLEHQLPGYGIDPSKAVYIGDTREDGSAAAANGLHFIAADWGYGDFSDWNSTFSWSRVANPAALINLLHQQARA